MKQFNLKEYLENPRDLVTRGGKKARLICNDLKHEPYTVVAAITNIIGLESVNTYTEHGELTQGKSNQLDLFFAPEKHEGWANIYRDIRNITYVGGIYTSEKEAKENIYFPSRYITTFKIEWEE